MRPAHLVVVVLVALMVYLGWVGQPEVSITFNVGEIIGGTPAGVGALVAGVACAFGRRKPGPAPKESADPAGRDEA